jgi:hypothetical protein
MPRSRPSPTLTATTGDPLVTMRYARSGPRLQEAMQMVKFVIGFVLEGVVAACAAVFLVLPDVRENYRQIGHNNGVITARSEIAERIAGELGDDVGDTEPHAVFFNVKTSSVVIVSRGGVKTLRTMR